jgi:hypothetical protein
MHISPIASPWRCLQPNHTSVSTPDLFVMIAEENSPVSRVSGDNKGASSSQTAGKSQQTSTGQGIPAVPAGNTHEAPFGNQGAKMPENASTDLSRDDCLAMGDLDIVKQYQELKLSNQHCNIPAKTISGNEVVAINGWVPSFGVGKDGHIESISDYDAPFNTSGQGSEENMWSMSYGGWERS